MVRVRRFVGVYGWVCLIMLSACATRQAPDATPSAPGRPAAPADLQTQIAQYVGVQEALAVDNFDDAKTALQDLLTIADATTSPLVRSAANAEDIETMRARFKPLSEYLAAQELPRGYARAYCPMYDGGSNWVQADGPVRNPYFGSFMLTCGVVDAAPGAHMDHSRDMAARSSWRRTAFTMLRGRIQRMVSSSLRHRQLSRARQHQRVGWPGGPRGRVRPRH